MTKTRFIAVLLSLVLLCGSVLVVPSFAAEPQEITPATVEDFPFDQQDEAWWEAWREAYAAEEEALAQRCGVDVDEIWKRFGGGIPSFLTEDLVKDIVNGQGIKIITPNRGYVFYPEQYYVDKENGTQRDIEMDIYPPETTELNSLVGIKALEAMKEKEPALAERMTVFVLCSQLTDALQLACRC